jgi:hypothetical protein
MKGRVDCDGTQYFKSLWTTMTLVGKLSTQIKNLLAPHLAHYLSQHDTSLTIFLKNMPTHHSPTTICILLRSKTIAKNEPLNLTSTLELGSLSWKTTTLICFTMRNGPSL